ncbi:MAG: DUF881 domain-containing protein [Anaerovorax sp.]
MKINVRIVGIFALCLVMGFSFVLLARGGNGMPQYVSPKTISDLKVNIQTAKKEILNDKKLVAAAENRLKQYEELSKVDDKALENKLTEELNFYKVASGETEVRGQGVKIIVDDGTRELYEGENVNTLLVHDSDILGILNELRKSGAEAISVNGQRITNTTAISCSGYTIRINGVFYARPFEIHAIGDAKKMAETLNGPEGTGTVLKMWGVIFEMTVEQEVVIPKYTGDQTYQYAVKVKEGEMK